ncbi:hypothetical protein [Bradyrhizobium symbiodeficiens]|uniref:hypothetical protein n=1 Tax=Bradyrhizobium symbiodeficiens TaxID=1404367 RepID=UPI000BA1AE31|nr:hypothetical protein [Bradyrhizobium symbiodeficiens]AWM05685.1 hypothetical protein CIT39_03920 [Bradyrhizobium symbiodeficiens]
MRIVMTSALALLALASLTAAVEAGPCPPGMVRVCLPPPQNDRPPNITPQPCKCEHQPASGNYSGGGKAEIHKKNVPMVKQNKSPGPND